MSNVIVLYLRIKGKLLLLLGVGQRLGAHTLITLSRLEITAQRHVSTWITVLLGDIKLREGGDILQGIGIQKSQRGVQRFIIGVRSDARRNVLTLKAREYIFFKDLLLVLTVESSLSIIASLLDSSLDCPGSKDIF